MTAWNDYLHLPEVGQVLEMERVRVQGDKREVKELTALPA